MASVENQIVNISIQNQFVITESNGLLPFVSRVGGGSGGMIWTAEYKRENISPKPYRSW